MSKRGQITVDILNLMPNVTLPRHLGMVLIHLRDAGWNGMNSFQLISLGCLNPASAISALKKRGAIIIKELRDVEGPLGEMHSGVAHYTYYGWRLEDIPPHNTTRPYKDLI